MIPPFERAGGHGVRALYAPPGALLKHFAAGEPADIFLTGREAIDQLIGEGKIVSGRIDLATTGIGICVRKGAPKPDVTTPDAFKRAMLAAKTVGYASPAGGSIVGCIFRRYLRSSASPSRWRRNLNSPPAARTAGSACWYQRRSRDRLAAGDRAFVEPRRRGDRHAAGGLAADHDVFRRHHDERQTTRRGAGADPGLHRAGGEADLQGQGARSVMRAALIMRAFVLAAMLIVTGPAQAAEIHALITTAMKSAIDELVPSFERDTGHTVGVSYGPSGGIARRFIGGEPADVIVIDSGALDDLIRQGKVLPDPTAIASTGIGICVRKGAPRPDVSTPEALKRALLAAKSIAHTAPAGGGITAAHVTKLFERLGIAAEVTPKVKLAAGGPDGRVSVLVSSGEAEIGLQQVSELMSKSRRGRDRHAARGAATDHDLRGRRHDRRQAGRRGAGSDPGAHCAVGEADLRSQGAGAAVRRIGQRVRPEAAGPMTGSASSAGS